MPGSGLIDDPWDIRTALNYPVVVQPGDTIWLRGGLYTETGGSSFIAGQSNNVVTVRSYPGEKPRLDTYKANDPAPGTLNYFRILGGFTTWRDLEFFNSSPNNRWTTTPGNAFPENSESNLFRGGVVVESNNSLLLNCVIHDFINGVATASDPTNGGCYGCIAYNNGYISPKTVVSGPLRGQGHGIYINGSTRTIDQNITYTNLSHGLHSFAGSTTQKLAGCQMQENVSFQNGSRDFLEGGFSDPSPSSNNVNNNSTYNKFVGSLGAALGDDVAGTALTFGGSETNLTITNNYLYSESNKPWAVRIWNASSITSSGNTQIGGITGSGVPSPSGFVAGTKSGSVVKVWPNVYVANRGHVAIYNWNLASSVSVNLSTVLDLGTAYNIYHVYDLNTPVKTGVYNGGSVSIPMSSKSAPIPLGSLPNEYVNSEWSLTSEFGAFLVKQQ